MRPSACYCNDWKYPKLSLALTDFGTPYGSAASIPAFWSSWEKKNALRVLGAALESVATAGDAGIVIYEQMLHIK